jgi:GTP cyclohydrolase I
MERKEIVVQSKSLADSIIAKYDNQDNKILTSAALYEAFMRSVGIETKEDPNCIETGYRVSKMFHNETCASLSKEPPAVTTFPNVKDGSPNEKQYDQYVVVNNMDYFSLCSHHHQPFFGNVYVAYHPDKLLCGLSKFHRVTTYFANQPQLQERMTQQIMDHLWNKLKPIGMMVMVTGTHLCMCARGTRAQKDALTITTAIKESKEGAFDKEEALKLFKIKEH